MFDNSDINRCPMESLKLYLDDGTTEVSGDLAKIIYIGGEADGFDKGKILIDEENFVDGTDPIPIKLGLITGFGEMVYKRILLKQKTQCQVSREMKRSKNSKCTVDQEEDGNFDERGKECSSMKSCYSGGYKNTLCPENHHCADWRMPNGKLYSGCLIS